MPRSRTAVPPTPPNSVIASAANVTRGDLLPKKAGQQDWQTASWAFYDTIGEFRYASNWIGNALSRVNLTVFRSTPAGPEPITTGPPADALDALFDGDTGQSQMMSALGIHLTVPGEAYIVGEPSEDLGTPDTWLTLSTDEIRGTQAGKWTVDRGDGKKRNLSEDALIIRVWRPHPRRFLEADSPTRAVLPILREIEQLTKHVAATIDSRLAGAGLLLLPAEMTFQSPSAAVGEGGEAGIVDPVRDDPFLETLTEAMIRPIEDRSSAAAVVPIVVKAPGDSLGAARYLTFSTPFDEQARALREEGIRRLALGMDMPPEIMLGQGDSNHWSSWQIEESALKIHIEPLCELICDALTRQYLWPVLGGTPDEALYIGFDTSALRLRPNRSSEAVELYDRLELSGDALRRETGFDEADKPDPPEVESMLLRKLALGVTNSDLTAAAVAALGIDIKPKQSTAGTEPGTDVSVPDAENTDPVQALPSPVGTRDIPEQTAAALMASCELLALRAIERANNRIHKRGTRTSCTVEQVDAALADAWAQVPRVAGLVGLDPADMQRRLDAYTRVVLLTGVPHSPELLAKIMFDTPEQVLARAYSGG